MLSRLQIVLIGVGVTKLKLFGRVLGYCNIEAGVGVGYCFMSLSESSGIT